MKEILKKSIPYVAAVVVFIVLSLIYAAPEVFDGKVLQAGDQVSGIGMRQEVQEYNNQGHYSWWTGSMFGGMPTYQIGGYQYPHSKPTLPTWQMIHLGFTGTLALLIAYFIGFFILLKSYRINEWLSCIGAIAITLSTYFLLIVVAGHNSKVASIAVFAPVIGGFYLTYCKKYLWGIIVTLIFTANGVMLHPQMTYYIFMLIGVLFCAELFIHIREKRWKDFAISTLIFAACFGIGVGTQITPFMANREYAKETMRGGHSELEKEADAVNKTSGLDLTYITQYSYGIGETATLLIPGAKGYASSYNVGTNSKIYQAMVQNGMPRRQAEEYCKNMPTYWGGVEGTSGPVYAGAIICFLFILGLLIVKGPYKWALLAATIFAILLSWGYNFMSLQELFAKYFPMYTKFRAVESILVVAEITIPLLGFLALREIMDKKVEKKQLVKSVYISAAVTAGICLLAFMASFFLDYSWGRDADIFAQWPEWLSAAVIAERASILRTSAIRSLIFVLLGAGVLWLYVQEKLKFGYFAAILGVLVLVDMWPIDRKFFNDDNFVKEKNYKSYFAKKPWEETILNKEKDNLSYRVFNLTDPQGPFNDSRTSYYFKSIGGYSAAKLRRYQDLIDAHLLSEINPMYQSIMQQGNNLFLTPSDSTGYPVLNMMNMKYAILNPENPVIVENPNAMGNAWFVDNVVIANTPNEESDALNTINLHNTLVTDIKFQNFVKDFRPHHDSEAQISLTKYAPDYVEYDYTASEDGIAVFSEIYYPYGWNAYIDGQPKEHFRANYTLRALNVPAGKHHIRFEFRPDTIERWGKVAVACQYIVDLTILTIIGFAIYRSVRRRKEGTV
ncbi:MAG: YfhO family protein [Bacteroidales bacterium]|nr:YfhO family protein [Bacteroidales bacterium]